MLVIQERSEGIWCCSRPSPVVILTLSKAEGEENPRTLALPVLSPCCCLFLCFIQDPERSRKAEISAVRLLQMGTISTVPAGFHFEHELGFEPEHAPETVRQVPELPGVFALFGHTDAAQPYVTRTANLRRRIARLVDPPEVLGPDGRPVASKRLNLRDRVARIAWSSTGSEFESLLLLYHATSAIFGLAEARRRLRLRTPYLLRLTLEHAHPRIYSTNRLSRRGAGETYGPFPSRLAADRYCDAVLDLFQLRRCWEDLEVSPEHPGCAYGEMKKCMEPCKAACTGEAYGVEALRVKAFLDNRGESLLAGVAAERDLASERMNFEAASALHRQFEKIREASGLADELVRPISHLRAVIVQPAAIASEVEKAHHEVAAVFLVEAGLLSGPAHLSTLGVRAVREQTGVGSSLFAQPLMLQAVPLTAATETPPASTASSSPASPSESPEQRVEALLIALRTTSAGDRDLGKLSDHLSLLRRWYYRPEKQRSGEIFLPNPDGSWPLRKILRGAARVVLGEPRAMQATDRDAARTLRTRVLHEGRPDVERTVPVLEKPANFRSRRRSAPAPGDTG